MTKTPARKSARAEGDPVYKQVFVIQPGAYARQVMTMAASHADAGLADGWAVEVESALPPNDTPELAEGEAAQSYADWLADTNPEPEPPPVTAPAPTLASLAPNSAEVGGTDVVMVCTGTGFTPASVIVFNGFDEPIEFLSDTQISTIVKPSIFGEGILPVEVRDVGGTSNSLNFTFTEAPVSRRG